VIREFLLARIAEDEAAAKAATEGPWRYNPRKVWYQDERKLAAARSGNPFVTGGEEFVGAGPDDGNNETTIGIASTGPEDDPESMANANHIARHDPTRVLAECAAKRAILRDRERIDQSAGMDDWFAGYSDGNYDALHALASVYKDHPDFDPKWISGAR
jgi:hypothetical protein